MSQQSFKERMGISSNENNPEIINEVPYNEKIFNKEILTEDHIDNYSIGHDVSKKIEVDITNLEKPLKITQSKHSIDNKGSSSKKKIDYQEIGDFMNKKKKKLEQKQQAINEEDRNYNKFQNTKLFQKFMKEEIGNDLKNACDTQPNLYENYIKNSKRIKSPAPNRRLNFEKADGDQELAAYSQIFVPGATNKLSSIYYPQQQKPQINIMDYAGLYPNQVNNNNDNIMFLPNNYYSPTKTFLPITSSNRMDEKNDIFAIQNKLVETQKALNEEILKKMNLETALKEQQFAHDHLSKNLEEFQLKLSDQNQFYTDQRNQFEDTHSKLTHKVFHLERLEENMKLEIDEMRRKTVQDNLILTNKDEEIKDLYKRIERFNDLLREKENLLLKKTDDLTSALKNLDEAKNEILYLRKSNEKLDDKAKMQESAINNLSNEGDFSVRRIGEMKDKIKDSFSENEKIKLQNSSLQLHLNQIQIDAENYKNEIFQLKQNLLEKQQKEINLVLALEKSSLQSNQLKKMLNSTEFNIEEQKNLNRNLVDRISEFATTANTSNYNNLKLLNNLYEQKYDQAEKPEKLEKPVKNKTRFIEPEPQQDYKRIERDFAKPPSIQAKNPVFFAQEKNNDMEYNNYDSFNDRDNRFQVKNYSIDYAAGSGYHRNESGKKLFHDKYKFNSIFPNNSSEKEYRNTHSNERPQNQNNSLNKSYDSQNYNSLQTGRNNFHDNNNQASASKINIDENASDVKTIESNLLVLQLQKQEMETELRKIEDSKLRTGANIKRKNELEISLKSVDTKISHFRLKLRGMNLLHR